MGVLRVQEGALLGQTGGATGSLSLTPLGERESEIAAAPRQKRSLKNAFAPVLGGGRFTQPGADGGDAGTRYSNAGGRCNDLGGRPPLLGSFGFGLGFGFGLRLLGNLGLRLCRRLRRGPVLGRVLGRSLGVFLLGSLSGVLALLGLGANRHEAIGLARCCSSRFGCRSLGLELNDGAGLTFANRGISIGRLGQCRERLDLLLRRSLERGVTLVAVTGTGRWR